MRRGFPLLVCLLLVLLPGTAAAKKKHKSPLGPVVPVTAAANSTTAAGQRVTAVATCPAGKVMIGGGFSAPTITSTTQVAVFESYRSTATTWTVTAITGTSNTAPQPISAFGYCRRSSKPLMDVTATGTVPSGLAQAGSTSATCPVPTKLVSGGFQSTNGPTANAFTIPEVALATSSSTWSLTALNNANGQQTITAHAYCLAIKRTPLLVSSQSATTLANRTTLSATSPSCPVPKKKRKRRGRRLLSAGGFTGSVGPNLEVITASSAGTTGWNVIAENANGAPASTSVTAQGICV